MRAKYHKHTTVLEAEVGYRPSFIWRSLLSAQDFLNRGLRWRIGNGDSVSIWGDRWVPAAPEGFIVSAPCGLPADAKVRELINPDTRQWDTTLLAACLDKEMEEAVHSIPLRDTTEQDIQIWASSRNGEFVVKDAYRCWVEQENKDHGRTVPDAAPVWKKIWKLNVPPKVRHFLWRFAKDSLPTGVKVSAHNPRWSDRCPFCDQVETQAHTFGDCEWGRRIWRPSPTSVCFEKKVGEDCLAWLEAVIDEVELNLLESWSVLLYYIWKERNAHLFNGFKMNELEIATSAAKLLADYQLRQEKELNLQMETPRKVWTAPPTGRIKINSDAGILPESRCCSKGLSWPIPLCSG
ncbi:unnamed protein product [Linum tenue]|uniref:Reverse transcriptase zinc-binding domain-containing protein n=1 Tax=Linum tenue TaxID=586396 RepID=A0AAV0J7F1_9ROSI|nr:unnamed protein product [Linum tenue]